MNPGAPPPCPSCGGKLLLIRYGMPGISMMEAANRGEIILGGCIISEGDPDLECADCGKQFRALDGKVQRVEAARE